MERVQALAPTPILITVSGGNPAIQPLGAFITAAHAAGYPVALETQGTTMPLWVSRLDHLVLSPKPPSSGNVTPASFTLDAIRKAGPDTQVSVKIVVFDDEDLDYAEWVFNCIRGKPELYAGVRAIVQAGNRNPPPPATETPFDRSQVLSDTAALVEAVLARGMYDVKVLPQLHSLLWGNARGV